jgi:hypothetical protein
MSQEPAWLEREHTERLLEILRTNIAQNMGVTLQQDHNGAWGPMGKWYLTMRFSDGTGITADHIEVRAEITSVSSDHENDEEDRRNREDK